MQICGQVFVQSHVCRKLLRTSATAKYNGRFRITYVVKNRQSEIRTLLVNHFYCPTLEVDKSLARFFAVVQALGQADSCDMFAYTSIRFVFLIMLHQTSAVNIKVVNLCSQTLSPKYHSNGTNLRSGRLTLGPRAYTNLTLPNDSSGFIWADAGAPGHCEVRIDNGRLDVTLHIQAKEKTMPPSGLSYIGFDVETGSYSDNDAEGSKIDIQVCPMSGTYSGSCSCATACQATSVDVRPIAITAHFYTIWTRLLRIQFHHVRAHANRAVVFQHLI